MLSGFPLPRAEETSEAEPDEAEPDDGEDELDPEIAVRIPMAPGVELLVGPGVQIPSPRRLVELAMTVRRLFKPAKEPK